MLLSRKIRPLLEITERLKTQAELTIPTLTLCTDVKGFGLYDPIEPAKFEGGKEHTVIVYCEVENFSSTLDEQKRVETRMTQDVALYTEGNGEEIWRDKSQTRPIVDFSRNRRHDFFIVKKIHLPANLSLGRYILKVSVVDQQVKRVAENTVAIQVVLLNNGYFGAYLGPSIDKRFGPAFLWHGQPARGRGIPRLVVQTFLSLRSGLYGRNTGHGCDIRNPRAGCPMPSSIL